MSHSLYHYLNGSIKFFPILNITSCIHKQSACYDLSLTDHVLSTVYFACTLLHGKVQLTRMQLCCILDKFSAPKGSLTHVFLWLFLLWNLKHALKWLGFVYMSVEQPPLTQGTLRTLNPFVGPKLSDGNESNIFWCSFTLSM